MAGIQQSSEILLVEEDRQVALSVRLQLEMNNFKVDMFTDPVLALTEFKKNPTRYNLIIFDMKMTRMSTFKFMREIKTENPESKILLITTFEIKPNEFSKVLPSAKVDGFIKKSFLLDKIIPSIKGILDLPHEGDLK
jgi:DNA-binding response OmpR family regulator